MDSLRKESDAVAFLSPCWMTLAPAQEPSEPAVRGSLTLREAMALAYDRNLALARARIDVPAAEANRRLFRSAVLPRLSLNGNVVRNSAEVSFGPPDDVRTILPLVSWDVRVNVSQPIFAGFRDLKAYRQSGIEIDSAREGVRFESDQALLDTSRQFLLALQAEALIEVEQKNLELARRRREQATALFEAGETTQVDVLRAEADIKAAERRVVEAERAREVAVSELRIALALDEDLALVEPGRRRSRRSSRAGERRSSSPRRSARGPKCVRRSIRVESAKLEVEKQRGAYYPVVTADAGYVRQATTFPRESYGFGAIRVSVPIYQGGEIGARVAIAEEREKQANLVLEETRRGGARGREDRALRSRGDAAPTSLSRRSSCARPKPSTRRPPSCIRTRSSRHSISRPRKQRSPTRGEASRRESFSSTRPKSRSGSPPGR